MILDALVTLEARRNMINFCHTGITAASRPDMLPTHTAVQAAVPHPTALPPALQ
ncbi:hypothetical protein [Skermania piniformis]|uniref:Uncharacterized protein n=1 Tax=Skermania pinensis TaxID=39122 RepID=A0ABX8S3X4_9ACTN|nr:hypothetical protein [Skermania piniformis]QXQ12520.1 hypothetical protein KV203_11055 [Skermania piniformis]